MEYLGLVYQGFEVLFLAENQGIGRAGVDAAGLFPALVKEVSAEGALLGDVKVGIEVDNAVGAGIDALSGAGAFFRVDDDDAVVALVDGAGLAGQDAGGVIAVLADIVHVSDSDLGHGALDDIGDLHPEVAGIGLGFGDRGPVVADVLVLAGDLAVVAAVALVDIDD